MEKIKTLTPKVIGHVAVDSGLVWIGDPCYILHSDDPQHSIGRSWGEFCDTIKDSTEHNFEFNRGGAGLGVVSSTKHGDGFYPVIGLYDGESKTPSAIIIDFNNVMENL
jgi:hypothetical protein